MPPSFDASLLLAAFIAGGMINYFWDATNSIESASGKAPLKQYEQNYKQLMEFVLMPFFFVSIGFSIPIGSMFTGAIVWNGLAYALLMIAAKRCVSSAIYFEYCENLANYKTYSLSPSREGVSSSQF